MPLTLALVEGPSQAEFDTLSAKVGTGASLPEDGALLVSDGTDTAWTNTVAVEGSLTLSATGTVLLASDPAYIQASGSAISMGGDLTQELGSIFVTHTGGTDDPSAGSGVTANVGSVYLRNVGGTDTTGEMWVKTGAADTAWTKVV